MAVLKCKMCGGNIEVGENQNIGMCDSCGSTMTIPNVKDERILNLFDRANHFRLQNEFDKALAAYESILSEDNKNAEAHWGCVLSRYGIEYVKDPKTHKRVPTCHRVQSESVLSDLDYKAAVGYTDDIAAKNLYQQEAEAIAEIQKNILSIANNEAPYDVFICYKETDNNGRRTVDSTLAQDIYYQLTNEGYKVFFSRITLEDKLGTEYEPYIFSALNSAKVMLVIGTSKDYFNAVWVKNEWARFLDLARKDKSKMIIPCYRDMDAYDLPDELSMFQSQDMGKIGFIQDLLRGIKKVLQKENLQPTVTVVDNSGGTFQAEPLLKRAFMCIEDGDYKKADNLLEQVLNHNPENAKAYLGKMMIDAGIRSENDFADRCDDPSVNPNYQKALRFANKEFRNILENYRVLAYKNAERAAKEKAEAEERAARAKAEAEERAAREIAERQERYRMFLNETKIYNEKYNKILNKARWETIRNFLILFGVGLAVIAVCFLMSSQYTSQYIIFNGNIIYPDEIISIIIDIIIDIIIIGVIIFGILFGLDQLKRQSELNHLKVKILLAKDKYSIISVNEEQRAILNLLADNISACKKRELNKTFVFEMCRNNGLMVKDYNVAEVIREFNNLDPSYKDPPIYKDKLDTLY